MDSLLVNLCDFIHEAQKERGSASLYLRSKGEAFSEDLESQFAAVDKQLKSFSSLSRKKSARVEPFLKALHYLPAKRKYVTARMLDPAEVMTFYTHDIIAPAIELVQELAVLDTTNQPTKVSAFINFLQWKERVGLERALGTQLINLDGSNTTAFKANLEHIVTEQRAYERMFLSLSDGQGKKAVEKLKKENDIFQKIEGINQCLANGSSPSPQSITAEEWFTLFTTKMDLLHEIGRTIAANLATAPACSPTSKTTTVASEQTGIESSVRAHMEVIQALPLFAGLDAETLQDILKYARIASHSRGAMIFMQGEQASRFYMVLEGCVKLYKGNADGQESVLQVMKAGDALLETVIFNNASIPVNAQAVDNVKLLSIPASLIREKLQNNKELAINMLATVAGRSQAMISQFEQLTLKTVTQRVGWFLLKLFLENKERITNLKLPYDKSLIAAYLGMKPETFSRTLQTLKEQGIDIERNTVNLSDVFALCNYCDMELAAKCSRHGTDACPDPNCLN